MTVGVAGGAGKRLRATKAAGTACALTAIDEIVAARGTLRRRQDSLPPRRAEVRPGRMRPGKPATRPRSTASAPQPDHRIDDGHRAAQIVGTDRPTDPWATVGRRRHDAARRRTRAICAMLRWRSARRRARAPISSAHPRSVRWCERIAHAAARRGECQQVGLDGRAARSVAATFSGRSARPTCSTRPTSSCSSPYGSSSRECARRRASACCRRRATARRAGEKPRGRVGAPAAAARRRRRRGRRFAERRQRLPVPARRRRRARARQEAPVGDGDGVGGATQRGRERPCAGVTRRRTAAHAPKSGDGSSESGRT